MDVAVNWSMLCQECRRAVFWAPCCSFCTPRYFFIFWRISLLVMLTNFSTHLMALYPCLMCQSELHAVLWSHIGILLRLLAAEPRSTAGLLFPSQYLSGMIWLTPYLMVFDWQVSRAGPMPFCWPSCSLVFCLQLFSLFLLFLHRLVVWGWVFGLIGCQYPSPSLSLPIFFNNNNKDS